MKVELVARTEGINKYEGLSIEEITSAIARHGIIKEDNGKLIKYLMKNQHWSPLDMVNFTFEIETSRAIGRQLLRHWTIKPQEHSQRYSDKVEFEDVELRKEHPTNRQSSTEVFDPVLDFPNGYSFDRNGKASKEIKNILNQIENLYKSMITHGVSKECARMILPECTRTTMTMNGSLRSWLTFLNLRMDHHTQKEAREIAELIGLELEKQMPNLFSIIDWKNGMFI